MPLQVGHSGLKTMRVERQVLFWLAAAIVRHPAHCPAARRAAAVRRRHRHRLLHEPRRRPADAMGRAARRRRSADRRRLRLPHRHRAHLPRAAAAHPGAAIRRRPARRDLAPARPRRDVGARAARHALSRFRGQPRPQLADHRREHDGSGRLRRRLAVEPGPRAVRFPLAHPRHAARRLLRADRLAPDAGQDRLLAAARPRADHPPPRHAK